MIDSVEHAYECIAKQILAFVDDRAWHSAGAKYEVFQASVGASWWREIDGEKDAQGSFPPRGLSSLATKSALFLRDDLLKTTGQRIWGLTFTLYPDGKFNIEYDYNKPDGYEETDDVISGDEINASLGKLGNKGPQ